jgi:hypothetical protein
VCLAASASRSSDGTGCTDTDTSVGGNTDTCVSLTGTGTDTGTGANETATASAITVQPLTIPKINHKGSKVSFCDHRIVDDDHTNDVTTYDDNDDDGEVGGGSGVGGGCPFQMGGGGGAPRHHHNREHKHNHKPKPLISHHKSGDGGGVEKDKEAKEKRGNNSPLLSDGNQPQPQCPHNSNTVAMRAISGKALPGLEIPGTASPRSVGGGGGTPPRTLPTGTGTGSGANSPLNRGNSSLQLLLKQLPPTSGASSSRLIHPALQRLASNLNSARSSFFISETRSRAPSEFFLGARPSGTSTNLSGLQLLRIQAKSAYTKAMKRLIPISIQAKRMMPAFCLNNVEMDPEKMRLAKLSWNMITNNKAPGFENAKLREDFEHRSCLGKSSTHPNCLIDLAV